MKNEENQEYLNSLFKLARQEQPVMPVEEANEIIRTGRFVSRIKKSILSGKHFILMGVVFVGVMAIMLNIPGEKQPVPPVAEAGAVVDNSNQLPSDEKPLNDNVVTSTVVEGLSNNSKSEDLTATVNEVSNSAQSVADKNVWTYNGKPTAKFEHEGRKIELTIGLANEVERLSVDGQLVSQSDYKAYEKEIGQGKQMISAEQQKLENTNNLTDAEKAKKAEDSRIMNAMIDQLRADGLIGTNDHFSFRLTGSEVFLNNEPLGSDSFEKFKSAYEKTTGKQLPAKANIKISH